MPRFSFILQKALRPHAGSMRGSSIKTAIGGAMFASLLFCAPAHATLGAAPFTAAKPPVTLLLKTKGQRDTANDTRPQNCKPAIRSMTEGQPGRNTNCPKRPILM